MENIFNHILYTYCGVENSEGPDDLREELKDPIAAKKWGDKFTQELKYAIDHSGTISPQEIRSLTGFSIDTQEQAQHWLKWLWSILFTDQPLNSAYLYLEDE